MLEGVIEHCSIGDYESQESLLTEPWKMSELTTGPNTEQKVQDTDDYKPSIAVEWSLCYSYQT